MEPRQTMRTTLRTPPFAFANDVLTSYTEGAKAYWRMWGPLGQPAIQIIDVWTRTQQRHLEAWEALLLPTGGSQASRSAGRDLLRDLFTGGFGVGFDG